MQGHRFLQRVGLGVAVAAVLAGGAQAAERPDDRAGMLGVGAAQVVVAPPDAFERAVLRHASTATPDAFERAVVRRNTLVVRPDDRSGARGPGSIAPTLSAGALSTAGGFQWDDALFGAVGMLGVVMLGTVVTLTIRNRGRVILR